MDTQTAHFTVRNQSSAMVEAEELIRSWLEGVENSGIPPVAGGVSSSHDLPSTHVPIRAWSTAEELLASQCLERPSLRSPSTKRNHSTLAVSNGSRHSTHGTSEAAIRPAFGVGGALELEGGVAKSGDFLSGLDFGEGDVRDNTRAVLQGLLDKPLTREATSKKKGSHDPRVTMEMRHREVRDRRWAREQSRARTLHSQLTAREARREAETLVRREEGEHRRRARREDALIQGQMAAIRREMRQERDRRRVLQAPPPLLLEPGVLDTSDRDAVMRFAGECVMEGERERKRVESRVELLRQLQEAEATEMKESLKLLHCCFSSWYTAVVERRAKLGKAAAVCDWKLLLRAWRAWRGFVGRRRERREREAITREMQREKSRWDLASAHYRRRLLLRCLSSWLCVTRAGLAARREEREVGRRRERMSAFLQAATEGRLAREGGSRELSPAVGRTAPAEGGRPSSDTPPSAGRKGPVAPPRAESSTDRSGAVAASRGRPEPTIWQTARRQLDQLLSEATPTTQEEQHSSSDAPPTAVVHQEHSSSDAPPTAVVHQEHSSLGQRPTATTTAGVREEDGGRVGQGGGAEDCRRAAAGGGPPGTAREEGVAHGSSRTASVPRKPQPKPVTKPIPMSGMEARSAELAHRRALREERQREAAQQRLAEKEREEAEKKRAELEAREARRAQLREERRLAKQHELELQQQQQRLAELAARADAHFATVLLRTRGIQPWRRFMDTMKGWRLKAEQFHVAWLVRGAFVRWRRRTEAGVGEREATAEEFHQRAVVARAVQGWKQYVSYCRSLEELADRGRGVLLQRRIFRAWQRAAREGRTELWTWERRARDHHNRSLKRRALLAWRRFVPLSREEKSKELRRADLRRKVAAWLPDYQPRRLGQEEEEDSSLAALT